MNSKCDDEAIVYDFAKQRDIVLVTKLLQKFEADFVWGLYDELKQVAKRRGIEA